MPVTRVNDIDMNYKLEGDGPETIVLINGLADDLETWAFQMDDFLGAGYRVLRFDNRGIGASAKPAGPYSSRMLADDAKALELLEEPVRPVHEFNPLVQIESNSAQETRV